MLFSAAQYAHDLQVTWQTVGPAVIVDCRYAGTEPAAYASVLVYSPADAESEFQNGRTDTQGRFSFVPDRDGHWKFIVDDEIGHRVEKVIETGVEKRLPAGATPMWQNMLTGVSLIAGATGFLYGWKARRAG